MRDDTHTRLAKIRRLYRALTEDDRRDFIRWLRVNHGFEASAWLMSEIQKRSEGGQ